MNTHLLIPELLNSSTRCRLWSGVVSMNQAPAKPTEAVVEDRVSGKRWPVDTWEEWPEAGEGAGLWFARTEIDGLPPRSRHQIDLKIGNEVVASALASTLPEAVPGVGDKPLTLLLGSCFCAARDKTGRAGGTFASIPMELQPEFKLLCGDQIYLDSPFYQFMFLPHSRKGLARIFLKNYAATWGQSFDRGGYQFLLSSGSNVFASDDHEFWNNAPFPSFSINTWTEPGRKAWWELASGLYAAFQTPPSDGTVRRFDVGELAILVADTRITRSGNRTTFLDEAAMDQLVSWIEGLTAPAILNVGQPLFAGKAGVLGALGDWNLPDFQQYATLCKALLKAPQPMLILTGDVHYGRVATAVTAGGIELIEVIASPTSLVTGSGPPKWHEPPAKFPAEPIAGVAQVNITPLTTWKRAENHFLTIELWQNGDRLHVRARTWETKPGDETPSGPVFEHALQRSI